MLTNKEKAYLLTHKCFEIDRTDEYERYSKEIDTEYFGLLEIDIFNIEEPEINIIKDNITIEKHIYTRKTLNKLLSYLKKWEDRENGKTKKD